MMLVILLNGVVVAVANVLTILVCFQLKTTTNKEKKILRKSIFPIFTVLCKSKRVHIICVKIKEEAVKLKM